MYWVLRPNCRWHANLGRGPMVRITGSVRTGYATTSTHYAIYHLCRLLVRRFRRAFLDPHATCPIPNPRNLNTKLTLHPPNYDRHGIGDARRVGLTDRADVQRRDTTCGRHLTVSHVN